MNNCTRLAHIEKDDYLVHITHLTTITTNKLMNEQRRTVRPKTTADAENTGNTWPCVQSRELAETTPSVCVIPGVHILYT
jgi:hypothetical protein